MSSQNHVSRITLQGAATWWIHCHDSRATCHIAGCSHVTKSMSWSCHIAGCKNYIRHIKNRFSTYVSFLFLMQFRLWQAAAFVSSPIHLFITILCTNELLCAVYVNLMETQTSRTNFTTEQKVDFIIKVIEQQVSSTTFAVTSLWRAT